MRLLRTCAVPFAARFSPWFPHGHRVLLAFLLAMVCTACATRQAPGPEAERPPPPSPEVVRIVFTGNDHFSSGALRDVMATKPRPWWPPWKHGDLYNAPTVEADILRVKKFYFDRGFLNTDVQVAKEPKDGDQLRIDLRFTIQEGPPTVVTAVAVTFVGPRPPELATEADLLAALALHPGQRLNKEDFDRSQDILRTRLNDAGYARAQVTPRTEVDTTAHTADLAFMLMPGARTLFGTITITGEQQVKEKAIRRQLTIDEGLQYSKTELGASADAIYGLGMFQAVTPRLLNLEEEGAPLNVEIEMRERQPHSFQFGFGYSTVERFRGQVQWLHRNLWGGAEQLTLSGKISSIEQKFEARLHLPYLWNRHTSFTQTLFVRNEQEIDTGRFLDSVFNIEDAQPAFDLFSYGGEARLEHQFTKTLSGFGGLSLSQNDFSNVNTAALTAAEEEVAQDNLLLVQFAELLWRTSDSLLNPTRGIYLSGRVDHSNASLLSDVSFIKLTLEARHYQRLWDGIILATRLKVGSIEPYGVSTAVPFNVLFFAGGPGSVRGFALNRLGPMNAEDDPIGGNSLLEGSVEVRFPIVGKLGGALFIDGGNVFQEAFTYRLNELRYAVGPGVRYDTPIGPIRLDLGLIVNRRSDENFGRVEFSIGQAF